ncbi:hypothetical protein RE428_07710 [Marinobacter nanhaiticus D15-8W]|uniref:Uncharacterized protein n=1 Tax=Marinobacter nanhaiticus D15-8W TaxID=626887 RepID=N6WSW3_9GAMM|nr:hypothetical protein [Marinobacter nanhaiticus]ENO14606.1 hypothetical protein J057_04626 [Marinobacter nanhaiticus D15-8W]BES69708.1 hypothetical protein RE428_07260 [Marinobacter nanhaiticus D15-8W]BES69753.1 hypothetical protein RE428_07710 [Marinobacter nanhaiticus D15-8W]
MSFNANVVEMSQQLENLESALLNEYGYPAPHSAADTNNLMICLAKIKGSAEAIADECEEAHDIVAECDDFRGSLIGQDGDPIDFDTGLGIELGLKDRLANLRVLIDNL